ncbi:fatty acid desaturase [Gordonia bronchialis DSM 43247]|uniref:Fatty acid desaturase n=1 Tax=Gordonia bronchialis (strain ATCC 25592 / DSM 43247 / BCRC 13721 / JCM 3198 / KCTC 3076 / NBRC 16047 / NCTC 10667) TaxID=526226 RepID=D0LFB3_GORB4|nr:fatty acid desaturase [Gordonia bronchialis]ACY22808.1 fatty acid desaturase [Gordonia bronchialis DSM 43247]MCC3325589.1 fatty acid desaturase [Gordonia bronchialis]QGS23742.1 acyl-CoA desaturase [Gordonia bronchialis]UAK40084.1 fatty acid desaturase [Gordonia bronchialis]STQ65750.1 Stearoyl-CoA 9-desaturase [Gordonia bronchialis]
MAITDIPEYAHLSPSDVEALGAELDAIRADIEADRGERDARYIRNTIRFQRGMELLGRGLIFGSTKRSMWWAGAGALGLAKIVENMELGHNVMHGQWDWMNDPEVHSTTWEWDNTDPSAHWKHTHNYIHHKYTNVLGMDDDVGYGLLRVTRDQRWRPFYLGNLAYNTLLALAFEYGVAAQHLELGKKRRTPEAKAQFQRDLRDVATKVGKQMAKDYVVYPALAGLVAGRGDLRQGGRAFRKAATANVMGNVIRNIWTNAVIFCGHFPDGAEKFTKQDVDSETQAEWYLRQMLGSANFHSGFVLAFLSGNLSYQIEHHIFPDLPSNRLAEISVRVRALCEKYDLPYTTGSFPLQYAKSWRTIAKLSLPDKYLKATADDAPETASERRFKSDLPEGARLQASVDPTTGRRRGLRTAIASLRRRGKGARVRQIVAADNRREAA